MSATGPSALPTQEDAVENGKDHHPHCDVKLDREEDVDVKPLWRFVEDKRCHAQKRQPGLICWGPLWLEPKWPRY